MKKRKSYCMLASILVLSVLLGLSSLYTPRMKKLEDKGFSAERAAQDIEIIAREPHTVNDPDALKVVRDYLIARLMELEINPEVFTYEKLTDKYGWTYDVNNIYGKIDGKQGEQGTYILLVAHYDSSPAKRLGEEGGSRGAADDGYGLSTILEVLRVINENGKELENGIKILFTDAEETGLLGAEKEMVENKELYENVSFVINLEARGIKGPAIMFETSDNNLEVIKLFKEAKFPVTYSLAADVYRKMPNGSDFTQFINAGLKGINMAVLDNLDYYHTPEDNYDNISLTSLQHYGEQVLPVVETFIYSPQYANPEAFEASQNGIYFTVLPNIMLTYSHTTGIFFMILAGALLIITLFVMIKKKRLQLVKVFIWTLNWLGICLAMALLGLSVSKLVSVTTNIPFKLTYMPKVPYANVITLATIILGTVCISLIIRLAFKKGARIEHMILGGLLFNYILLLIFMIVLPGGSFMFLWPVVVATLSLLGMTCYTGKMTHPLKKYIYLISATLTLIIFVPILYVLNIALTIGALCVVMLLAGIAMSVVIPSMGMYLEEE